MTKKIVNVEAQTVEFQFDDGGNQLFDLNKCSEEMKIRLALHGFSQKGGDSYAGAGDESDPVAYAKEAVKDTIAQVYANDWRVTAAGGPRVSDLATALSQISGKTLDECIEKVSAMTDETKKAARKHPAVAAKLAEISARKASEKAARLATAAGSVPALQF